MLNQLLTATSIWDDQQRQEVCLLSLANLFCLLIGSQQFWLPYFRLLQLRMTISILPACQMCCLLCASSQAYCLYPRCGNHH